MPSSFPDGPTAGMFDSIFFNCLRVIGAGIAIGLCSQGNILGTFIFILLYGISQSLLKWVLLKLATHWAQASSTPSLTAA